MVGRFDKGGETAQRYVTAGERSEPADKNAPYLSASKKSNNVWAVRLDFFEALV